VFVRDHPFAVDLAVAKGRADPHVDFSSVESLSAEMAEMVTEGDVIARRDGLGC
jgi:hypothetical protein